MCLNKSPKISCLWWMSWAKGLVLCVFTWASLTLWLYPRSSQLFEMSSNSTFFPSHPQQLSCWADVRILFALRMSLPQEPKSRLLNLSAYEIPAIGGTNLVNIWSHFEHNCGFRLVVCWTYHLDWGIGSKQINWCTVGSFTPHIRLNQSPFIGGSGGSDAKPSMAILNKVNSIQRIIAVNYIYQRSQKLICLQCILLQAPIQPF